MLKQFLKYLLGITIYCIFCFIIYFLILKNIFVNFKNDVWTISDNLIIWIPYIIIYSLIWYIVYCLIKKMKK